MKDLITYTNNNFKRILSENSKIKDFHNGKSIDKKNYTRHIIEGINRIHLNNEVDALALLSAAKKKNNKVSKLIATYLEEEISHDELISKDIEKFGMSLKQIQNTKLFFSTELLIGYLKFSIEKNGYLPCIVWSWFVEWYSNTYNPKIVGIAKNKFGEDKTKGMRIHLEMDNNLNHTNFYNELIEEELIDSKEEIYNYLEKYIELVKMYFEELLD